MLTVSRAAPLSVGQPEDRVARWRDFRKGGVRDARSDLHVHIPQPGYFYTACGAAWSKRG